jgi:hypothetical protein
MNYTLVIYESAEDFAARKSASTGRTLGATEPISVAMAAPRDFSAPIASTGIASFCP